MSKAGRINRVVAALTEEGLCDGEQNPGVINHEVEQGLLIFLGLKKGKTVRKINNVLRCVSAKYRSGTRKIDWINQDIINETKDFIRRNQIVKTTSIPESQALSSWQYKGGTVDEFNSPEDRKAYVEANS